VPEYDPLTISAEDLKALPPAERAAVYKARATAARGGAPAAPPATPAAAPAPKVEVTSEAASAAPTPPPPAPVAEAPKTAAPPPAPKEPEKPSEPAFVQHVLEAIDGASFEWRHGYAEVKVPRERLLEAARSLRDDGFDYLSFITEVDWQQHLELIYHLFSYDYRSQPLGAILRCELPRDGVPEVASLTAVWPGAEFMEREAFEMMGISFLGHPDLRRILLPDDFVGFPMRRDFETDWDYITVKQLVHESD
jgi:NADH-quinone oxidoreductase subunit C